ncbi:MAG TPA: LPS assembly protein LptD [Alphaproteobacteria bacterium]|nr:LPS assembly protein LptD [Alphaproteobacteria bacterium]
MFEARRRVYRLVRCRSLLRAKAGSAQGDSGAPGGQVRHRGGIWRSLSLALAGLVMLLRGASGAELPSEDQPVLLMADEVSYDRDLGVVTARGNVELSQGDRILLADTLTYNERSGTVAASGNVSLLEPNGDVAFADYVELTSGLREGVIRDIRVLLADGSRIAANGGRRRGETTEFAKGVYSPCPLCEEDPTRAPLWQLKAVRVTHDREGHRIEYRDAWLEMYGVPIAYTPYFSHPDPTVTRQSGLLVPEFSFSNSLGPSVRIPYYFTLGPSADATFEPIVTSKQGIVLGGEYRRLLRTGEVDVNGSITRADRQDEDQGETENDVIRGHIDGKARFDHDENWRLGADLERASDKTYRRLYDFGNERTLTSQAFAERFEERSYGIGRGLWFEGLRDEDNNDEFPLISPEVIHHYVGEPWGTGNYLTFDAGLLNLSRLEGRDSRRLHSQAGWHLPYTSRHGFLVEIGATIEADGYWVNDVDPDSTEVNPADGEDGITGRIFPQLSAELRYPMVKYSERFTQVIEPTVAVIAAPEDPNPDLIPNEDSQDFELDETNLFDPDRTTGIDQADGGQRVDYGMEWSAYGAKGGAVSAFLGQSYRFSKSEDFAPGSGIEDDLSDLVGRVDLAPIPDLDLIYRFRLDSRDLAAHRNELQLAAGTPDLNLRLSYIFLDDETDTQEFGDREEIFGLLRGRISENWSGSLFGRRDLELDRFLSYGFGLTYENWCLAISAEIRREEFDDQEIDPETKVLLRITFKTLGGVGNL